MVLGPSNYFQFYDGEHADFQLGANGDKLSQAEEALWQNIALYARVIKECGLQGQVQAAYEEALRDYAATENERHGRYHSVSHCTEF